jgi:HNH endonuclease
MACMFCGSETDLTREHVFPAFMGGELTVPDGSCKRCNGEFGKWECALRESTKLLLNLLQIENRDGEVPTARVEVEIRGMDAKGLFGKREADGTVTLSDVVVSSVEPDGKKHRQGFFLSQASAERFIERASARGEKMTELPVPEEVVLDASYTQTLPFAFSLEARKVVAKIALASIAHKYGVPFALSPEFDSLRQVRTATTAKEMPLRVFCNKNFIACHTRNAHQHSVVCYLSAGKKKGWALVTLFGGLSYVVEVAGSYEEPSSRLFSIFYDADLKKPFNPIVLADEMTIIGDVLSKNSIFEDRDALDEQWFPILAAYCSKIGVELERIPPSNSAGAKADAAG